MNAAILGRLEKLEAAFAGIEKAASAEPVRLSVLRDQRNHIREIDPQALDGFQRRNAIR